MNGNEKSPGAATPGESYTEKLKSAADEASRHLIEAHSRVERSGIRLIEAQSRLDKARLESKNVRRNIPQRILQLLTGRRFTHQSKRDSRPRICPLFKSPSD